MKRLSAQDIGDAIGIVLLVLVGGGAAVHSAIRMLAQ